MYCAEALGLAQHEHSILNLAWNPSMWSMWYLFSRYVLSLSLSVELECGPCGTFSLEICRLLICVVAQCVHGDLAHLHPIMGKTLHGVTCALLKFSLRSALF